jgi:hypothetical protein
MPTRNRLARALSFFLALFVGVQSGTAFAQ